MRVTVVYNPRAGDGTDPAELEAALRRTGHQPICQSIKDRGWQKALPRASDLVLVAGGDGTVAKVARALRGRPVPIAIVPAGTANNISTTIGKHPCPLALITSLHTAASQPFDLGVARGPWGQKVFLEGAGIGLFARMMALRNAMKKKRRGAPDSPGDELREDLHVLAQLAGAHPARDWTVRLDGEDLSGRYVLVEAMNIRSIGPRLRLAPDADPGDGLIDLVRLSETDRPELAEYIASRLAGEESRVELTVRRGRHVQMSFEPFETHADDRLWPARSSKPPVQRPPGGALLEVSLEPGAVTFIRP